MLDTLGHWDPCSSEHPRAAWGHGRLFLTVRWAGSVVGRGVQVVGALFRSPRGDQGPWREWGHVGTCGGIYESPGAVGLAVISQGPGHLFEDRSVLWASWVLSGWSFLFAPQPGLQRPRKMQSKPRVLDPVDGAAWI